MKLYVNRETPETALGQFINMYASFCNVSKANKFILELKDDKLTRSQEQNNLYWKWIRILGQEIGIQNEEETSEIISEHLLGVRRYTNPLNGEEKTRPIRTSKLKVDEMSMYLDKVNIFAGTIGVKLPQPEKKDTGVTVET
mgnify:CR=1 FL=1